MPETPQASAAIPHDKPEQSKPEFKFVPDGKFSLDYLLTNGVVEGTVVFNEKLKATYRTLTVQASQAVEASVDPKDGSKTLKFVANELTILQLYYSLVSINDKVLPPPAPPGTPREQDRRMQIIRELPTLFFDQLCRGLAFFDERTKELISKGSVQNF